MGEDSGEKTEEPTPHKLREARKKGQIAKSKEFTGAVLMLVSFYVMKGFSVHMWNKIVGITLEVYSYIPLEFNASIAGQLLKESLIVFLTALAPLFAANVVVTILFESLQTGFLFSLEPLMPKLEKLNPIEGFKKFVSMKQYVELVKSLIKMTFVVVILYYTLKKDFIIVVLAQQLTLWNIMAFTGGIVMKVVTRLGAFYIFVAALDYMYQKYEFIKSMRMSKKEIKDEYKRLEGDPQIKQRQREAARQMAQGRQMGAVPNSDVVVTNPFHVAVALSYDEKEGKAPKIVAKGQRLFALQIRKIAEENFVPIIENPPLARGLYKDADVDGYIPSKYFHAVAQILAFVYNLRKKRKKRF